MNAVVSTILVAVLYNALRPVLLKSGMLQIVRKQKKSKFEIEKCETLDGEIR